MGLLLPVSGTYFLLNKDYKKNSSLFCCALMINFRLLKISQVSNEVQRRNVAIKATSVANQLYVKNVAANDGLSEVAAREMAEILGFAGLIPSNTIAGTEVLEDAKNNASVPI